MVKPFFSTQMGAANYLPKIFSRNSDMQNPRFRLFGGPNGSGKTHVFDKFKEEGYIHTEIYVNADKIESELKENRRFSFNAYRVKVDNKGFKEYIISSGLYQAKLKDDSIVDQFVIR